VFDCFPQANAPPGAGGKPAYLIHLPTNWQNQQTGLDSFFPGKYPYRRTRTAGI
jgi:hypothetical protein